ncbi:signal peptide peptidase SppA [Rhodoblastus acidophilus]|uniref:Signal peptide peptidase SppA n=1 Tax=Candidatus Rhodoblastus alkanivorans TaxID=2954117 RepID=A0ABS9Z1Q7_9HYPH|nr:signal peptide peptidase SppA [Candidatus Rhodoblastus alkanivorans]MCI4678064.1 signal peptide peptidase SppA [Candidatus Rhodoblastus alkanivorans]MCI4681595.1 signal peptide peptidase SppA [Candidatus Rhodoblastus alkanivorans]MDI4642643.1 signal peptide peptidase SppA [Rhodoblastus acidophilus]
MTEPTSVETILDRRQLRRKLTFWRLFALAAIIVALVVAAGRLGNAEAHFTPHIARIEIRGLITGDRATLKLIKDVGESRASAVIVDISSPGGTVTGSEQIYDALRLLAKKKPVVAVVNSLAASGAYIVALGADRIFASDNALVGSIGVLFEFPNVYKLLDNVGVKVETIKSSPLKASPNGFEPTSPAARAAIDSLVVDSYDWFKKLVKTRRNMTDAELAAVSDGRVFTGHQGLPLKLIDAYGGEREAVAWLEKEKGVAKGLPVRDWKKPGVSGRFGLFSLASDALAMMGYQQAAEMALRAGSVHDAATLDGLLAIWQVGAQN